MEALAGTLAADSTTDDDLVCEWGPVEGQDGVWELPCHRDEDAGETAVDDECRCWYLVTYRCHRMECTKIREDFLGCDPNCSDGDDCDETQREVYGEYNNAEVHGGLGMSPLESPSSCEVIEHHLDDSGQCLTSLGPSSTTDSPRATLTAGTGGDADGFKHA